MSGYNIIMDDHYHGRMHNELCAAVNWRLKCIYSSSTVWTLDPLRLL